MSRYLLTAIVLLFVLQSYGQKSKYKDFFPLLEAKQYDQAEGYLKAYVFNPKNADHANSQLHLGYLFEDRLLKADILKDTAQLYGWGDSAALYLAKAKALINDKELKKRDEYYQAFYRRDLRSGEFGIKLSDVHLEIDKKLEGAKSRTANVKSLNANLRKANQAYNSAVLKFTELNTQFSDYNLFLIKSNDLITDILSEIATAARKSKGAITEMKRALSLIENPGFGPEFKYKEISSFPQDGVTDVDFFAGQFDLWNLQDWAGDTKDKIESEIEPMKSSIIAYDRELTDYKSNLFAGGTNGSGALSFKENILGDIQKYDEQSILKDIIDIKLMDINILKVYAPTLNSRAADKEDMDYQLIIADSLVGKYGELGEVVDKLGARNIDADYEKYSFFFENRMKGRSGLDDFIETKKREVSEQTDYWQSQSDFWLESSSWALMEFGSIPLFTPDSILSYPNDSLRYVTLSTIKDDSLNIYPIGLEFGVKNQGYLASVAKNRDGTWYLTLDLGKMTLEDTTLSVTAQFVPSSPDQYTFYYYSPASTKDNFVIFSVDRSGSQIWRNAMQLEQLPFEIKFNETVFETIIYIDDPENPPEGGTPQYVVIDRTGKLRN